MTVTQTHYGSMSYSVTAGASAEIDTIFAKARAEVSGTITKTSATGTTNAYTHPITAGKYGNAQLVNWGEQVSWKKTVLSNTCKSTVTTGSIWFPTGSSGWYYWETTS